MIDVDSDLCLNRMAQWLAKSAVSNPANTAWLRNYEDEVYSESLLAVTKASIKYPGQVSDRTWTPGLALFARGCLIAGLVRQRYLPSGVDFHRPKTNWNFDDEEAR